MIEIDGSQGEGGGQILRTALALSICTGQPFTITQIRARRSKPGLLRQHLTAVQAAQAICGAGMQGATPGSQELSFAPGQVRGGDYRFAIGTAGSSTLVLQAILPPLLQADTPSTITLSGGTHNPYAPPFDFLQRAFLPLLEHMGVKVELTLNRYGFYPSGGGEFSARIEPCPHLQALDLSERGRRLDGYAEAYIAALPLHIAERELAVVGKRLGWGTEKLHIRGLPNDRGPGNALLLTLRHTHVTEVFTGFGERGVTAENIAKKICAEALHYLASDAAVGEHLADQLILPLALSGRGSFTTVKPSQHLLTNIAIIQRFLPVRIMLNELGTNRYQLVVSH